MTQKHLALTLDYEITFQYHVNEKSKKAMKVIGLFSKITVYFTLIILTIYKSFIRPHLDYGDVVYNKLE